MQFFNSVKALYLAVAVLVLTLALGYHLDVKSEAMHARHLEISTELERMIRLDQELMGMLTLAVVEINELRVTRYETVRQDLDTSIKKIIDFTKEQSTNQEIASMIEGQKRIRAIEATVLQQIRATHWKEAHAILFGDKYLSAKKIYEIDSEAIPGVVLGEINAIEKRFYSVKSAALYARIGALSLLIWTGIMFSRRTRADLAEQVRLRTEISKANEVLEERVLERTKEVESTMHKLNAMSQAVNDALVMIDGQGKVLFWNQAAEKLFGFTAVEAIGMDFHNMAVPTEVREKALTAVKQFGETGQGILFGAVQETTAVNRMGMTFPVEVNLSCFQLDDEWFAVGTVRDITERKQAEAALRTSQNQMRTLVDSFQSLIFMKDGDGRYLLINAYHENTTGIPNRDVLGKTDYDIMPRELAEKIVAQDRAVMESRKTLTFEMPGREGTNRIFLANKVPLIDENGAVYGLCGISTDITERKQAEKELKEQMEELERFSRLTVNREEKMIQLKEEINNLCEQAGKERRYKIVE